MKKIILAILMVSSAMVVAGELENQSLWWVQFVALGIFVATVRLSIGRRQYGWN